MSVILFGHIVSVGHHKNILLVDNQGKQGSTYEHRDMKSSVSLLKKKKKRNARNLQACYALVEFCKRRGIFGLLNAKDNYTGRLRNLGIV